MAISLWNKRHVIMYYKPVSSLHLCIGTVFPLQINKESGHFISKVKYLGMFILSWNLAQLWCFTAESQIFCVFSRKCLILIFCGSFFSFLKTEYPYLVKGFTVWYYLDSACWIALVGETYFAGDWDILCIFDANFKVYIFKVIYFYT